MGVPVLPVAIGLYLPFELSASILVGGILRYVASGKKKDDEGGILFCSGLIAGEGLMGIVLALLAVFGKSDKIDLSHWMDTGIFGAAALVFVIAACILISAREKKKPCIKNSAMCASLRIITVTVPLSSREPKRANSLITKFTITPLDALDSAAFCSELRNIKQVAAAPRAANNADLCFISVYLPNKLVTLSITYFREFYNILLKIL